MDIIILTEKQTEWKEYTNPCIIWDPFNNSPNDDNITVIDTVIVIIFWKENIIASIICIGSR